MSRWMGTQFGAATSVSRSEPGRVNLTSTSPEIGIYAEVMAWILSYVLLAAGVIGGWYLLCVRANRNRAVRILHWIESALGGQGHVTGMTWITASEFEVPVRLSASVFRKSKLLVCMTPRELPLNWLIGRLSNRHPETLTFTADLDLKPSFVLQVQSMRWFARSRKDADPADGNWTFENNAPVVLTTCWIASSAKACSYSSARRLRTSAPLYHSARSSPPNRTPGRSLTCCGALRRQGRRQRPRTST